MHSQSVATQAAVDRRTKKTLNTPPISLSLPLSPFLSLSLFTYVPPPFFFLSPSPLSIPILYSSLYSPSHTISSDLFLSLSLSLSLTLSLFISLSPVYFPPVQNASSTFFPSPNLDLIKYFLPNLFHELLENSFKSHFIQFFVVNP
jgi:hypothetical protein